MTRAGNASYDPEGNFLRTLYVQAYSPFSMNDYQTITSEDAPEDAACLVIKMLAAGIPAYSIDFDRLCEANKKVLAHYNGWYNENVKRFRQYREILDGGCGVFRLAGADLDLLFLVNQGGPVEIRKPSVILNGAIRSDLFLYSAASRRVRVTLTNCFGEMVRRGTRTLNGWRHLEAPRGGLARIEF